MRSLWFNLARRNANAFCFNSPVYFCEDHFDLPNDMDNYMEYHVMGFVSKVRMKPGCVPTKFECQPDRTKLPADTEQTFIIKKERQIIKEEAIKKESSLHLIFNTHELGSTSSGISEEIVVKTENAEEIFIKTEPIYPDETVPEVADVRFHDKGVQTKPDVEDRGVQGCPRRFRSKAVQYNSDVPPRITFLKLVRDETEKMMVRVYKYLRDELEILKLMTAEQVLVALEQVSGRAAQATGVSELDMQQTLDKYKDLLDKQPTKKTLDKTNKPKKKRKQGMHVRTFSFSNESTDDEQPPKVRGAETDSGSAGVSVQTVTEPSAMEVDCGGGNSIDETTARRETSVQEEVHDSNGESTDEALEEEPEIYIKDEPLTEDDDSANPLEIGVVAPSIAHTAHTPSDTYTTTTTDIQTYDPGEDVRIKTEYGEPEPSHDHTYHKNT
ncbi:uncharacterized protein LOC111351258 isoform X6 [Spodoptera litura]|uniref:Uncharacterized protein LOC111351258 isoform X6 n=1 Tax=Spodoptera litura TaxID=69820 RepID=A0A9J7IL65_SPOLT|nr:uncharacterized protein LOC111351258 isoform X6 [Spodoptera litura]